MSDARRIRITRRDLLKLAQVGGVAVAAGGLALVGGDASSAERKTRGICRICTMHCGVVATVRGDQLVRVEGDRASATSGFLCEHGQALREIVHSDERLRAPLKREGQTMREISWEQALAEIAERLDAVRRRHGGRALALQTGWPFVRHPLVWMLHRFARAFGSPNVATVASLCEAVGRMGKALTVGSNVRADLRSCRTLLVWGANPPVSSPPFAQVIAAAGPGRRNLIVIDPHRSEAARSADLHLALRPGTDGALALGLLHVVVREGLHDESVLSDTIGFEELSALAAEYPPERVASICGVAASDVERVARLFAREGPSAVWDGLGIEHHGNGLQTVRAVACLEALCGHLGVRGGGALLDRPGPRFDEELLPALYRMATPEPVPPPVEERPIGGERFPIFEVYNRQAQANLFAHAILDEDPYPLRALVLFGANPLVTSPGAPRLRRAYAKLDLLVTVDPFLTETGEASDYVLPAATFAEAAGVATDERVMPEALVPPIEGAWPDWKILFELARAVGLGRYFPWSTLKEALEAPRVPFMTDPTRELRPDRPDDERSAPPRWGTPSGKIELRSALLERFGYDALPRWTPPRHAPTPEYPVLLVSGPRTRTYVNSQFRKIPSIAAKLPAPFVEVPPAIAGPLGLESGDWVAVVSPHGRIELEARVTDRVHPETVVLPNGWPQANANVLVDGDDLDPVSGFPAFRSAICRLEPLRRRARS